MPTITIKHCITDAVVFTHEVTNEQQLLGLAMRATLEAACNGRADLSDAYLRGANLRGANLSDAYLRGANLRDAELRSADLRSAYLGGANLRGANLGGAYLGGANLRDADLSDAYLRGAYLRDADLRSANLRGANLGGAYLGGATLRDADLSDAYLSDAYLGGADLSGKKLVGDRPVLQIGPIGSRQDCLLSFITDGGLVLRAGCFEGSRDEFAAAVEKTHGASAHGDEYRAALVLIDAHAKAWTPATA